MLHIIAPLVHHNVGVTFRVRSSVFVLKVKLSLLAIIIDAMDALTNVIYHPIARTNGRWDYIYRKKKYDEIIVRQRIYHPESKLIQPIPISTSQLLFDLRCFS
jgi:hypothetical protein